MTTTMHFGPEWMRTKQQAALRPHTAPSPPLAAASPASMGPPAPPGAPSYSALLTPAPAPPPEKGDLAHPFKYSRTELLRIWKDGGGRATLPIEVERWEGIVREVGGEPLSLKEPTDGEKKLFASSINSELRRRQSIDYIGQGDRPKMHQGTGSPLRENFPGMVGRRRRGDSNGADQRPLTLLTTKQSSWSTAPLTSPSLASPRNRIGGRMNGGFDGVLKMHHGSPMHRGESDGEHHREEDVPDIKEEEEILSDSKGGGETIEQSSTTLESSPSVQSAQAHDPVPDGNVKELKNRFSNLSLNPDRVRPNTMSDGSVARESPLNGEVSEQLASVEWSYVDFYGNLQGPFRADTMQNWYEGQFFTDELLMKRTHLDNDWISVAELKRRIPGDKIFLTPFQDPPAPPGLSRRGGEPPFDTFGQRTRGIHQEPTVFDAPFQPIPQHSARSVTLDSYLNNVSTASDSPSSSYGAGGFASMSPDPLAVGGRMASHVHAAEMHFNGRVSSNGFASGSNPAMPFMARRAFNDTSPDPTYGPHVANVGDMAPPLPPSIDVQGFSTAVAPASMPWQMNDGQAFESNRIHAINSGGYTTTAAYGTPKEQDSQFGATLPAKAPAYGTFRPPSSHDGSANNAGHSSASYGGSGYGAVGSPASQHEFSGVPFTRSSSLRNDPDINGGMGSEHPTTNGIPGVSIGAQGQLQKHSPALQYANPQSLPSFNTVIDQQYQQTSSAVTNLQQGSVPQIQMPARVATQSPWGTPQDATLRRRPFDVPFPTSRNTIVIPVKPPAWTRTPVAVTDVVKQQNGGDDGWGEYTEEPQRLTFSHVSQHNQLQEDIAEGEQQIVATPIESVEPAVPLDTAKLNGEVPIELPAPTALTANKRDQPPHMPPLKRQASTTIPAPVITEPTATTHTTTTANPAAPAARPPSPPATTPLTPGSKAAWATEEDAKKQKSSGVTIGLREIQEAEKKRQDARKAVEKEKERAARVTASSPSEVPAFTATWGLPTSQVSARPSGTNAPKDTTAPSAATLSPAASGAGPAWTSAAKAPAAKKTMKEIQEEEERRKKLAKEKETVAQAAKRAYAESAVKVQIIPSAQAATGSAWTTVGAGGKSAAGAATAVLAVVAAAPRPTMSSQPPASSVVASSPARQGVVASTRPTAALAVAKATSTTKPVEEEPAHPSLEFMNWLRTSLMRGLNSSVQFEDIAHMLLSFPLDPDPLTVELITETIYGASTTLDGRRFAAEFITKRRADAASRPRGPTAGSANGRASLADVVKTQPKPAPAEWGYKVVKKKGKAGRT